MKRNRAWCLLLAGLLLGGCSGDYSGGTATGNGGGGVEARSMEEHFSGNVQSTLEFCRTCHVPGGLAATPEGERFMLSGDRAQDLSNLKASWERMGGNNPVSRILIMASGQERHAGGTAWPQGSAPYRNMEVILKCFADPSGCAGFLSGSAGPVTQLPLLGSKHAQHVWASYCEGKPDDAVLPPDPRSLIRPGVNSGKAVFYNAYWDNCHANMPVAEQQSTTCGQYRARRDGGLKFLQDILPMETMTAEEFNESWKIWGLSERPENFEALYTLRYGLNHAPFRNPYPLPGEDYALTDGGSGQLPLGMRQIKDADGNWTGKIGTAACFQCHGGQIGSPADGENLLSMDNLGLGNNNFDVITNSQDAALWAGTPLSPLLPVVDVNTLFNIGIKQRGQNNAVGAFEFLITLLDLDSLGLSPDPLKTMVGRTGLTDIAHPLAHTQDTPPWWNMGSRPRKFFDAGISNDSTRIIMAAGPGEFSLLLTADGKKYRDHIEKYDQDLEAYFLSLRSPQYPAQIDTALAEQGAILFHAKDLWAVPANAAAPKPLGGNGSCASCHGVYSPRYVNDPTYLENPVLEGVAGHISPLAVIGTDTARSDMLTPTLRKRWVTTFWGYPDGVEGWVAPEDKNPLVEVLDDLYPVRSEVPDNTPLPTRPEGLCEWQQDVIGYQAPPLYGVWATAPYFHNGSVPTIDQVLDSSKRSPIWQRKLEVIGPVKGFDQRMSTAYDYEAVGWKHDVLSCGEIPGSALFNCNPVIDKGPSLVQMLTNSLNGLVSWTGIVPVPDPTPGAGDKRLVYDTRILGNGNGGHTFTDALTPQERKAVIEYLKTL